MNDDIKIINQEKMLTRIFKENNSETNPGVEKALSVISKDTAHLPGCVINTNDIMNNPGLQVLTVKKVGDNIITITPYSVFVNHGGANAHNTKEYKLNYSMIGDNHNFCHNNKDTIMHIATGNNTVLFITIKENSIEEINITPCPTSDIYNCCSIYYKNKVGWWIFTNTGIYYLLPSLSLKDTWNNVAYESYASLFQYTYSNEPVITWHYHTNTSSVEDGWYGITLVDNNTQGIITVHTNSQDDTNGCFVPDGTCIPNDLSDSNFTIETASNYEYSLGGSTASSTFRYIIVAGNYNGNLGLAFYILGGDKNNKTVTKTFGLKKTTISMAEVKQYKLFPKNYIINYSENESNSSYYYSCELWINKEDSLICTIYNIKFYFTSSNDEELNSYIYGIEEDRTISLKTSNFNLINLEPSSCFYITYNGHGDERSTTYKAIYYIDTGELEFYTGTKNICGMFYTYRDTVYNATTSNQYLVRSKVDVTQVFKFDDITNEHYVNYTGDGDGEGKSARVRTFPTNNETWTAYPDILTIKTDSGHLIIIFPNGGKENKGMILYDFLLSNYLNKITITKNDDYSITVTSSTGFIEFNTQDILYYYFYKTFSNRTEDE